MAETMSFPIGAQAWCDDGPCGTVRRVVIDPLAQTVTHLVVDSPHPHPHQPARLVPVGIAESNGTDVWLRCTTAEFERFDPAEETQFLAGPVGYENYGPHQVLSWPYFRKHGGQGGAGEPAAHSERPPRTDTARPP